MLCDDFLNHLVIHRNLLSVGNVAPRGDILLAVLLTMPYPAGRVL